MLLNEALDLLAAAAERAEWEEARAASIRAKAALDQLVSDDPDMPPEIWFGEEQEAALARAATAALDHERLDIAADFLESQPTSATSRRRARRFARSAPAIPSWHLLLS